MKTIVLDKVNYLGTQT